MPGTYKPKTNTMSYVKIWVHAVWGTKYRHPILAKSIRVSVFKHIKENAKKHGIHIDFINGVENHVHCLLLLNAELSISKALNLIKGESSHWANDQKIISQKFEWADDYYASSVSDSAVKTVREYIRNQEKHHEKFTFDEEYQKFLDEQIKENDIPPDLNQDDIDYYQL
jgi:REP element-mobilizing transposase RayT